MADTYFVNEYALDDASVLRKTTEDRIKKAVERIVKILYKAITLAAEKNEFEVISQLDLSSDRDLDRATVEGVRTELINKGYTVSYETEDHNIWKISW